MQPGNHEIYYNICVTQHKLNICECSTMSSFFIFDVYNMNEMVGGLNWIWQN